MSDILRLETTKKGLGMSKNKPKFPDVEVSLAGRDGNAFAVLGAVRSQMVKAKISQKDIDEFFEEAMSGDYDHLLRTVMKYVTVS
jgi:hypothetical protein